MMEHRDAASRIRVELQHRFKLCALRVANGLCFARNVRREEIQDTIPVECVTCRVRVVYGLFHVTCIVPRVEIQGPVSR